MSMDAFQASLMLRALRLHFTSDKYDWVRCHGKVRGNTLFQQQRFASDPLRWHYQTLARHPTPQDLCVSNLVEDPRCFVTELVSERGLRRLDAWQARQGSLGYRLAQDLSHFDSIAELRELDHNGMPVLLRRWFEGTVTAESCVLIDRCVNELSHWQTLEHPLVKQHILRLVKYKPFVHLESSRLRQVFHKWHDLSK